MKKEVLVKAVKELDELLYKTSELDSKGNPEKLKAELEPASKELKSDDEISKETLGALTEIWKDRAGELTVKVCDIFRALGILPAVEENKQEEEAQIVPDEDTLVQEINDAERIKDLKDIARSNDEFKAIRGTLNSFKEMEDLRSEMLAILDVPAEEVPEVKAEAEKEKAVEPEYVKKGNEKKKEEPKATMKIVPKDKPEKKAGIKKVGIIASIVSSIEKSGKKGISKEQILEKLMDLFPDREEKSMKNTINVQVPNRITKEKFPVEKTKDGNYRKV